MATSLPNVKKLLQQASDGEKQALKHLGIDRGFTYECPPHFNPATTSKEDLQQQLTDTIFFAEAANRLHMDSVEDVARTAIKHIIHSYFCLFDRLPDMNMVLSGQDLAKELLDNVAELTRATQILNRFDKEHALVPAEETNESDSEDCSEEYHPEGSSSESCSSSEDQPKRKRSPSPATETSPKKTKTPSLPKSPPSTARSHHKKYTCPVPKCSFHGSDLRRHLHIHVRKREVDENEARSSVETCR